MQRSYELERGIPIGIEDRGGDREFSSLTLIVVAYFVLVVKDFVKKEFHLRPMLTDKMII